jgi:hypothetical protein
VTSDFFEIGDNVRIVGSEPMSALGYADRVGVFYGFTSPSVTGVEVVGEITEDVAFAVDFGDGTETVWFSPHLVELVDQAPGITATVGDQEFVKGDDGRWVPVEPDGERTRRRRWYRRA